MTADRHNVSRREIITAGVGAASAMLLASGCRTTDLGPQPTLTGTPEPLPLAPDADIRCGMIGLGGRGTGVLRAIHTMPGVRFTALCDTRQAQLDNAAKIVAEHKPAPRLFTDWQEMLKFDQLDAVYVMTPCYLHAEMVIGVLKSGRHCFGEKPMAITVADLDEMVRVVNRTRRVYQVGTQLPYNSPWHASIKAVQNGEIGEPVLVRAHRHNVGDLPHDRAWFFDRKKCGDTILEQAVHELDIFNVLMGGLPLQGAGFGGQAYRFEPPGRNIRDHYALVLDYGKNRRVSYSHSWISVPGLPFDGRQQIIYGTEAAIDIEGGMFYPCKGEPRKLDPEPSGNWDVNAAREFFDCIRTGRQPLTDAVRGRNGSLTGLLGLKALDTERVVTMREIVTQGYAP